MAHQEPQPRIPATEYPERWRKVQAMMAAQDLDVLVAYADDRASFGPAHARWLADFPVHFEPACILVPRRGDPVMLVGPESDEYALLAGRIADVRVLAELTHPERGLPVLQDPGPGRGDLRHRRGHGLGPPGGPGRGGLIGADLMAAFRASLPAAAWIDVENDLCDLRAQKSPAELDGDPPRLRDRRGRV